MITPYKPNDALVRDAFGRLRVSDPVTLFDSQAQYDLNPLLFNNVAVSGATIAHSPTHASALLAVNTWKGATALRQTRDYFRYQPGKSQNIDITFTLAPPCPGRLQEIGYGDDSNGIFLQDRGGVIGVVRRSSVTGSAVDEWVPMSEWNVDPMDGSGPSRITLDPSKSQIFVIDLQWLGVGIVRVGFSVDGFAWEAHRFYHVNRATGVYMTTANLPVRWKIKNVTSTPRGAFMQAICCTVISEGGFEDSRGLPFSVGTAVAGVGSVEGTAVPLLAIRPAATFNSIINRSLIRIRQMSGWSLTAPVQLALLYNPVVAGGSWGAVNAASAVEVNLAGSFTGGTVISRAYVPTAQAVKQTGGAKNPLNSQLPFTLDHAGANPTIIGITATRIGGSGTATAGAEISWDEYR